VRQEGIREKRKCACEKVERAGDNKGLCGV